MIAIRPATHSTFFQSSASQAALVAGEVLTEVQPHTSSGAAVTATMQVPLSRDQVWAQLTDYPRWTSFFPDITHSKILQHQSPTQKRILQGASKSFFMLSVAVEIQLQVDEIPQESIRFSMVDGGMSFRDFAAVLEFKDLGQMSDGLGTQISYTVQATPTLPVPAAFIEQAMKFDLPQNMRHLRRMLLAV